MNKTTKPKYSIDDVENTHGYLFTSYKSIHLKSWQIMNASFLLCGILGMIFCLMESSSNLTYKYYTFFPFLIIIFGYFVVLVQSNYSLFSFNIETPSSLVTKLMDDFRNKKARMITFLLGLMHIVVALGFLMTYTGVAYMHPLYFFIGLIINGIFNLRNQDTSFTQNKFDKKQS